MTVLARFYAVLLSAIVLPAVTASDPAPVKRIPARVLVIGDSLSVGPFGDSLVQYLLARFSREDLAVFASCGSSPESWLRSDPDYITKCGFREDTPKVQMTVDFHDGKPPARVRTPKIEDLIARYRPTTVIIQQGTNWMDPLSSPKGREDDKFTSILDRFNIALHGSPYTVRQIVWITPPDASRYSSKVKRRVDSLIRNAANKYNYYLVISSGMVTYIPGKSGGDGVHFNKAAAKP